MADDYVVAPDALQSFAGSILRAIGAPDDVADEVARHLVRSNLSGHDSHGVIRIPWYVAQAVDGSLVPSTRPVMRRRCWFRASRRFAPAPSGRGMALRCPRRPGASWRA